MRSDSDFDVMNMKSCEKPDIVILWGDEKTRYFYKFAIEEVCSKWSHGEWKENKVIKEDT